jgi:hypothetical protein
MFDLAQLELIKEAIIAPYTAQGIIGEIRASTKVTKKI